MPESTKSELPPTSAKSVALELLDKIDDYIKRRSLEPEAMGELAATLAVLDEILTRQ